MDSTLNPNPTDPIARYFEQIALEDEQIARTLADDAARHPPAAVNNVQVPGDRPSFGRPAVRGFVGLLLAACVGVAAVAWQSYGDAAKPIIAREAPQLVLTSSLPLENPGLPAQPSPPAVQASAATAAPPQPAPLAQTAAEGVAPAAAAPSADSAQLLQSMALDLATARQEIEQLKAKQMSRDIAKASKQNLRPKISAPPTRGARRVNANPSQLTNKPSPK